MQTFKMRNAERIAGLFVIAVFVSGVFIIMFMARQQEWFSPGYAIRAVFARGNDLVPNTPVYIEGIDVGKVRKVGFDEQNRIEVTLWIKERFMQQIRRDSYAAIKRPNLFGNPILEITLGSPREPVIPEDGVIKVVDVADTTMKDLIFVTNNLIQVLKEFVNPEGPYQKTIKNVERITASMGSADSSLKGFMTDDGTLYRDSREILSGLNAYMKANNAVPIELSKNSELIVNLSERLDKQTDIFVSVAGKMDQICDKLVKNEGMAGAMINDREMYNEMISFMHDSKSLLNNLNQLSSELKLVIPKLPELIDSAKTGMKEMQEVMEGVKRLPFIRTGIRDEAAAPPVEIEGRLERKDNR